MSTIRLTLVNPRRLRLLNVTKSISLAMSGKKPIKEEFLADHAMKNRVSMRAIAKAAGVHHSTVSLAFRNHPSIPVATRDRIKDLAAEMGYRPDPALSSLVAYRQALNASQYKATLAWITGYPKRDGWRRTPAFEMMFDGAKARAEESGYKLDEFWVADGGLSEERAVDIFKARNISGLIFAPQPKPRQTIGMNLDHFCAVSIGRTLQSPRLLRVVNNQFKSMYLLVEKLFERGYRRIGLYVRVETLSRTEHNWLGGFVAAQTELLGANKDWIIPARHDMHLDEADFKKWFRRYRPEAIISGHEDLREWLKDLGQRIPQDVGVVYPAVLKEKRAAGINENNHAIGAVAVDSLVGLIHLNHRGEPESPRTILIDGEWQDGNTVLPLKRKGAALDH